jgi:Amt family ammonium transporter
MAHSSWNPEGVANKWGALDFAGGTPVHISSGTSSLAYTLFYRVQLHRYNKRQRTQGKPEKPAQNWFVKEDKEHVPTVVIGTILLWIGWFGFNGGSALGANMRAVSAIVSTHLAACAGGVTGAAIDYVYNQVTLKQEKYKKEYLAQPSFTSEQLELYRQKFLKRLVISFCNGAVAGMVAITPAAGYVSPYFAPIFGLLGSFCSSYAIRMSKHLFDTLDIFAIHAIAGFVGMLLTGIFARYIRNTTLLIPC